MLKATPLNIKRIKSFQDIAGAISRSSNPIGTVLAALKTNTLKLAYQYWGYPILKFPNGQNVTLVARLSIRDELTSLPCALTHNLKLCSNTIVEKVLEVEI